jgi:hypothetical protein
MTQTNRILSFISIPGLLWSLPWALLLATAGGWAWGWRGLWAFSFLIYLPSGLRWLLAAAVIAAGAFIPHLRYRSFTIHNSQLTIHNSCAILSLAALLFWFFREQTYQGDALLKLQLLATHTLQSDPYVWKEPLDSVLAYRMTALLRSFGQPPEVAIALLSVIAGVIYSAAVLWVAAVLGKTASERLWYIVGLFAIGSSQLWFGHIENYSWVTAVATLAVALAVGYLQGRNPLWPVGLTAGLAVSLHPQAAFILPALWVLLKRGEWPRQVTVLASTGLVGPLLTGLGLALAGVPWPDFTNGYAGDPQLFLTPRQVLAPQQLADAFNNLWLLAPLLPVWLGLGLGLVVQRPHRQDKTMRYLALLAAGLLLYHFWFQNDLPRPQDWDLFAIGGPGLTLWGLVAWRRQVAAQKALPPGVMAAALTFAVLFTTAWVGVNYTYTLIYPQADQRTSYERYRLLDLSTLLPLAVVTPATPLCAETTGCARVELTSFTMPQDGDSRPTIFAHAPARLSMPLPATDERTFLWLSPALDPAAWGWGGDGVTFRVLVEQEGVAHELWARHLTPTIPADLDWQTVFVPLEAFRGRPLTLILIVEPGPANNDAADRAGWGLPWLMRGTPDERFEQ